MSTLGECHPRAGLAFGGRGVQIGCEQASRCYESPWLRLNVSWGRSSSGTPGLETRHGEIYCSDGNGLGIAAPGHRCDEFPAGYSSAGCSPAEPTSASPAGSSLGGPIRRDKRLTPNGDLSLFCLSQAWGPVQDVPTNPHSGLPFSYMRQLSSMGSVETRAPSQRKMGPSPALGPAPPTAPKLQTSAKSSGFPQHPPG